jgi:VanZ family protein
MADHRGNTLAAIIDLLRRSRLVQLWAPVFVWMGAIPSTGSGHSFYFSSRPNPLGFLPLSRHTTNIDKLAHIGEYAGLVALLYRALTRHGQKNTEAVEQGRLTQGKPAHNPKLTHAPQHLCAPALIALAYALSDEIHQELAPGRGFELADIVYDLIGIIAALGLIWMRERGRELEGIIPPQ